MKKSIFTTITIIILTLLTITLVQAAAGASPNQGMLNYGAGRLF